MKHSDKWPGPIASFGLPQLPKTVPGRPRIVQLFEDSFAAGPLVIVRAAVGCGKTSAVADWAASSESRITWINLGDEDCSAFSTWERILRSSRHITKPGSPEYAALNNCIAGMNSGEPLMELILRTVASIGPVTLVLDGMKPCDDPSFLQDLVMLLTRIPSARAVLIYREYLPPEQGSILGRVDVSYICEEDLYLTPEEVRIQALASGSDLDPHLIHLHAYGFPTLVRALLTVHREVSSFSGMPKDIEDLVASWIRSGIFESVSHLDGYADFLLKTSIVHTLTADLAAKLTGRSDSADILYRLASRGFLVREPGGGYRYRPGVLRALRAKLDGAHPEMATWTRRILIEHYLDSGMAARALGTAVASGDFDTAERIAAHHHGRLVFLDGDEAAAILAIADFEMLHHPVLAMTGGLLLSRKSMSRDRGLWLLNTALAGIESAGPAARAEGKKFFPLAEMVALRATGKFSEAVRMVPRALEALESSGMRSRVELSGTITSTYIQGGLTLLLEGWTSEARALLQRAATTPSSFRNDPAQLTCLGLLALTSAVDGKMVEAEEALAAAGELFTGTVLDSFLHAPFLVAEAYCALERGNPKLALEVLTQDGLNLSDSEIWPIALGVRAMAELLVDPALVDLHDAERELSGARPRPTSRFARSMLMAAISGIHLVLGNAVDAAAALEGLGGEPNAQLGRARLALAEGDFVKAEHALPSGAGDQPLPERVELQCLLMKAGIAGHDGRLQEAKMLHEKALRLKKRHGLGSMLSIPPDPALEFLPWEGKPGRPGSFGYPAVPAPVRLTSRELVVLKKLASSVSAAVAARELGVSLNTIKAQSRSIYRKLSVSTLRDALAQARTLRLI